MSVLFLNKHLFLLERQSYIERKGRSLSSTGHCQWKKWAGLKPEARKQEVPPGIPGSGWSSTTLSISHALLLGIWVGSAASGARTDTRMGCWYFRQSLNHSADLCFTSAHMLNSLLNSTKPSSTANFPLFPEITYYPKIPWIYRTISVKCPLVAVLRGLVFIFHQCCPHIFLFWFVHW